MSKEVNLSECSNSQTYVPPGMPALDLSGPSTSFFEFWPMWLMYLPVVFQWLWLSLWYRSLTLPLISNPAIPLSGMVGVQKSAVFDAAGATARDWILPWCVYEVDAETVSQQRQSVLRQLEELGLRLPIVGKPNIGCRGAGVKLLKSVAELEEYLAQFPLGASLQFQKLSAWDAEAGVFYVRDPGASGGRVTSLTLKYTPYVVGDGERTLEQLVADDPRAGDLIHLYSSRHAGNWQEVIPEDQAYRLVFSASHCRGAIFRDASELITPDLVTSLDRIFDDIPGFYYGRLDIKFKNVESLRAGEEYSIIEINGASSESINIWDRNTGIMQAVATLLQQYRTLFKLGNANRSRGIRPPGLIALIKAWRFEADLVKHYPQND